MDRFSMIRFRESFLLSLILANSIFVLSSCETAPKKGKEAMVECATRISSFFDERFPFRLFDFISYEESYEKGWNGGGNPLESAPLPDTHFSFDVCFTPSEHEDESQKCHEEGKYYVRRVFLDYESYPAPVTFRFNGWSIEDHPSWPEMRKWFQNEFKDYDIHEKEKRFGPLSDFEKEKDEPLNLFITFFENDPPPEEYIAQGVDSYYRYSGLEITFTEKQMAFGSIHTELVKL